MDTCSQCGGEIIFRYVYGALIPIHLSGGCYGKTNSNTTSQLDNHGGYNLTSNYRIVHNTLTWHYHDDDYTRATICPIKGCYPVYFVRHNGGSVWFDSLGKPWPKHLCFDRLSEPSKSYNTGEYGYNTTFKIQRQLKRYSSINNTFLLGVIIQLQFAQKYDEYRLVIKTTEGDSLTRYLTLGTKINYNFLRNISYLVGELVLYYGETSKLICLGTGLTLSLRESSIQTLETSERIHKIGNFYKHRMLGIGQLVSIQSVNGVESLIVRFGSFGDVVFDMMTKELSRTEGKKSKKGKKS